MHRIFIAVLLVWPGIFSLVNTLYSSKFVGVLTIQKKYSWRHVKHFMSQTDSEINAEHRAIFRRWDRNSRFRFLRSDEFSEGCLNDGGVPHYVSRDMSGDGITDFAVLVKDNKRNQMYIVVFNGPFSNSRKVYPKLISKIYVTQKPYSYGIFFKTYNEINGADLSGRNNRGLLLIGACASEASGFWKWNGKRYRYKDNTMFE